MRRLKLPGRDVSRPRLEENDIRLIHQVGIDGLKDQAREIVEKKLKEPGNDRRGIPERGNPVYKALHACNAASRDELFQSHRIPEEKVLTGSQVESIVNLATRWIAREYNFFLEEEKEQSSLGEFSKA